MRFGTAEPDKDTQIYANYSSIAKAVGITVKQVSDVCFTHEISRVYNTEVPPVIEAK